MKQEIDIKQVIAQTGIHIPDPDYIMKRFITAKPEDKKAWMDLFDYYKGAKKNEL